MSLILTLHPTTTSPSSRPAHRPVRAHPLPADFDMSPEATAPYLSAGALACLHELGELGPLRTWDWSDEARGWLPKWEDASDACMRPAWRYCPPRCKCHRHCPAGCACERHSVDGLAWPLRRELLDAHAAVGLLDVGVVRWEFEVEAGLRHDDEVVHGAVWRAGRTGCFYCDARLNGQLVVVGAGAGTLAAHARG